MSSSGALFDMDKVLDISKNVNSRMTAEEVFDDVEKWAEEYDPEFASELKAAPDYAKEILAIGRGGKKPRKDIAVWSGVKDYMGFFYDKYFVPAHSLPENISAEDAVVILEKYPEIYDENDEQDVWFNKIKELASSLGYAADMKEYKKNPENFKGSVADIAMILRIAVTGKTVSPDTYAVMKILGAKKVDERINAACKSISEGGK